MNIFTLNQKGRVATVMASSPRRATLATSNAATPLGVNNYQFETIKIYPNPTAGILNISMAQMPDSFIIYNNLGQVILNKQVVAMEDLSIDTSAFSKGVYFIKINKEASSKTVQFIRE
jgi:hypothetical protein